MNIIKKSVFTSFILIVFSMVACESDKPKKITEYYENGYIKAEYYVKNGKKEGTFKRYSMEQKNLLISEYNFMNDIQEGKSVFYFPSTKIQEVQYYENGKRQKSDTVFYESGAIEMITDYKDDKKHGYTRKYNEDGKLFFEALWENDKFIKINESLMKK
jgi:antitoxin component YwqK of YwqJK toxin-antitoxin module